MRRDKFTTPSILRMQAFSRKQTGKKSGNPDPCIVRRHLAFLLAHAALPNASSHIRLAQFPGSSYN